MSGLLERRLAAVRAAVAPRELWWIGEQRVSYGVLFDWLDRFVGWNQAVGWRPGARVGLACRHDLDSAVAFAGLLRCGVTAVMLDPEAPMDRLRSIVQASELNGLIADHELVDQLRAAGALPAGMTVHALRPPEEKRGLLGRLFGGLSGAPISWLGAVLANHAPAAPPVVADDAAAYLLFTSGSTSAPKGVEISAAALFAQLDEAAPHWEVGQGSRVLNLLPLHHADGQNLGPVLAWWMGAAFVRPFRFRVDRMAELVDVIYRERVTHFIAVPSLLALALDLLGDRPDAFRTGDFKHLLSTAAYLDPTLWERFQTTFGVRVSNNYGLTETVNQSLYCGPTDATFRLGTVGKPLRSRVRVMSDDGREVAVGETGELWMTGPNLMTGYFRNPGATAEVLADAWLRTGDLATIDADGFVRIVGRKKSVIITGGINIYPEEIDEEARALPGVRDAATVAVTDRVWGERAVTCVEPAAGATLDPEAVHRGLAAVLAPEKRPWRVLVVPALPRGPSGKVLGPALRAHVEEALAATAVVAEGPLTWADFLAIAAACFHEPAASLRRESTADDVGGWSSLSHLELILAVETRIGREFAPREVLTFRTLGDVFDATLRPPG